MLSQELMTKYIPEHLHELAVKLDIPESYLQKDPELIVLVLESKSLATDEEKQSWLDMIKIMNPTQIEKLRDILVRERNKLKEIEEKYEKKKAELKEKYEKRIDMYSNTKRNEEKQKKEQQLREQEINEAESLLEGI